MEKQEMIEIVSELVEDVRILRMEADGAGEWVTPPPEICLAFAVTEIGEVVDAKLREDPQYARSNAKVVDVADELGDTAIMLASFLISAGYGTRIVEKKAETFTPEQAVLPALVVKITGAWYDSESRSNWVGERVVTALCAIVSYMDHNKIPIFSTFQRRIERLILKWIVEVKEKTMLPEYPQGMRLLKCQACSLLFLPNRTRCPLCECPLMESDVYQPAFKFDTPPNETCQCNGEGCIRCNFDGEA